ncbi:MAG: hypothetical protein FJ137_10895 [Deltaproteobacteria bacterium]|nr:hypothetical protein [Deltaproteobacteria bacterium]
MVRTCPLPAVVVVAAAVAAACERPPVGVDPPAPNPEDPDIVDVSTFVQDRPAIGGKWYEYTVDGHVLTPRPHAWLLRTGEGDVVGFRIVSVYDPETGASGRFTLEHVRRAGAGWSAPQRFVVDGNVKDGPPLCVDLVSPAQRDCAPPGWQLRLVQQSRLSVAAGFAVAEPALFLADDVVAARVDLTAALALDVLPDPASVAMLAEAPPADPTTTDWDFARFARDLPENGRALGALERVDGRAFTMVTTAFSLATVTITRGDDDTAAVAVSRRPIDRADGSLGETVEATATLDLAAPRPLFLKLDDAALRTPAEDLADVAWPTTPPFAKDYDLVVVDDAVTGDLALLLSPATALRPAVD